MSGISRDMERYISIEKFNNYELTQCISYEMAIRNPKYKRIANQILEYYRDNKKYIDVVFRNELEQYVEEDNIPAYKDGIIYFGTPLSRYGSLESMIKSIDIIPLDDESYKLTYEDISIFGKEFYAIVDSVFNVYRGEWRNHEEYTVVGAMGDELTRVGVESHNTYQGFTITTSISDLEDNVYLDIHPNEMRTVDKYRQYIENSEDRDLMGVRSERLVRTNFKRPLIKLSKHLTVNTKIELNLHKPIDELISYITHIKETIDENNILKFPIELLGEPLEVSDTKLSRKKIADKFFVYDYVTVRLEQIEKLNIETERLHSEEVARIKSSPYLDGGDRTTQINMLKKDLRDNLINTGINDILKEEELVGSIPSGTAKRYYYEMKPYIEEEKYKELITGILT